MKTKKEKQVSHISDSVIYTDLKGVITRWSKQAESVFGWKEKEVLGRKFTEIMLADKFRKTFTNELKSFFEKEKLIISGKNLEAVVLRKNRKELMVEIKIISILNEKNGFFCITLRDNSERKKIEEELRQSELRYRTIIDQASDSIMITDATGNFIDVNSCLCKLFGYTREELLGKNISMLIEANHLKKKPIMFSEIMAGQSVLNERKMIHRDGTIIEVEANVKMSPDRKIVAIARDITARKKMENILKESEFKYRKVTENEIFGVAWATPEGVVMNANSTFCKMLGFSLDELKGMHFSKFTHPDDTIREMKLLEKILKGETDYYQLEKRYKTRNGDFNWVELNLSCYRIADGKSIEFFIGIVKDINERKKAEEEIKKSHEELRQLSSHLQKVREDERTNISREIHDVLGHQLTCLKMDAILLNKKLNLENKDVKESRKKITEMITLIDETVKTVRHISTQLRPGILDDLGLVDTLDWETNDFQKRTGIRSRFASDFDDKVFEKNIATGIYRVYQEALTNIARHAQATEIRTTLESVKNQIVLKVQDNGKGFEESEVKSKKTLGLIGMQERAGMIGGVFTIKSVLGQGTIATLEIPLNVSEVIDTTAIRILIADDHNIVRRGLKEFLFEGFPNALISEAENGNELIKMARSETWDIVISDVSMPGRNGLESLKQLKEEYPKLPVLILSMHPEDQYAIRAIRAGAAGYLTKESAPEELVVAVRKILSGKRYITVTVADKLAEILEIGSHDSLHQSLSDREFDVLKLIASGRTVSEIAQTLSLSVTTVSTYRSRILFKMKLRTNAELTQYAIQNGLV